MTEFQSNWKNFPHFRIKVEGKHVASGLNSITCSDFIKVDLNILQIVILMCKNTILNLLLNEHDDKPTDDDWINHNEVREDYTKMAKCYFSPLHLALKLNLKGLYKILDRILTDEKKRVLFWKKKEVKEILHNAVHHPSSLAAR